MGKLWKDVTVLNSMGDEIFQKLFDVEVSCVSIDRYRKRVQSDGLRPKVGQLIGMYQLRI